MSHELIPTMDPIPLPAPYWVFKLLLIVTFALHILAMNFLLGGMVLALASRGAAAPASAPTGCSATWRRNCRFCYLQR